MHPNPPFRVDDRAEILRFVAEVSFAHLFTTTPEGPMIAHAPLVVDGENIRFHLSRRNRIMPHLADGTTVLASIVGLHGYVSPTWYATRGGGNVPTWNYVAAELEGTLRVLDEGELVAQLDGLAAAHEPAGSDWRTRDTDPEAFRKLLLGVRGFELVPSAVRMTRKLSQNRSAEDRVGVVAGLNGVGLGDLGRAIEAASKDDD